MHGSLQLFFYMPSRRDQGHYTHAQTHTRVSWARAAACVNFLLGSHSGHTPVTPLTSKKHACSASVPSEQPEETDRTH
jgi:hypothetical protein